MHLRKLDSVEKENLGNIFLLLEMDILTTGFGSVSTSDDSPPPSCDFMKAAAAD
jgi:hypothetical protein